EGDGGDIADDRIIQHPSEICRSWQRTEGGGYRQRQEGKAIGYAEPAVALPRPADGYWKLRCAGNEGQKSQDGVEHGSLRRQPGVDARRQCACRKDREEADRIVPRHPFLGAALEAEVPASPDIVDGRIGGDQPVAKENKPNNSQPRQALRIASG